MTTPPAPHSAEGSGHPPGAATRVLSALRSEIAAGTWAPGDRLPSERALTEQFDASRVVVREALATLRTQGMIESRPGSGAYVTAVAPQTGGLLIAAQTQAEILDCLELRRAVEVEAAGLAAKRASSAQLHAIAQPLAAMGAAVRDGQSSAAADWAFHLAIAQATNNPFFPRTMQAFGPEAIPRLRRAPDVTLREREESLLAEHRAIFALLEIGDSAGTQEAMRVHLTHALDRYRAARAQGSLSRAKSQNGTT